MRQKRPSGMLWLGPLSGLLGGLLSGFLLHACTPGRDGQDDTPGIDRPDLSITVCSPGSLRCSVDQASVQECQGNRWKTKSVCDVNTSQVCRGERCIGPCDDLPSGSGGCSFYPVNLWSTSSSG